MKLYGLEQVGCYADGTFGHDYVRSSLALLLHGFTGRWNKTVMLSAESLMDELCADPSDDFSEEDDAIALLNEHATDGTVYFGMFEGDLVLASICQWEAGSIYSEEWYGLESGNNVVLESSEV